jgi:hypothetical protein
MQIAAFASIASLTATMLVVSLGAQPSASADKYNYDEAKVPPYTLPDPLTTSKGKKVTDRATWMKLRRPELLKIFEENEYGRMPGKPQHLQFRTPEIDANAIGGTAVRKQIQVSFSSRQAGPSMNILMYLPKERSHPVPVFVGLNFRGNHTIQSDPAILLSKGWIPEGEGVVDHRATDKARGTDAKSWPVELILSRGYGVATIYAGDLAPDDKDHYQEGVFPLLQKPGEPQPRADESGAIGLWAWGLSRALDYLQTDHDVDAHRVIVIGHSRMAKAAIWAGARDPRFAAVVSNESGEGGAALSHRIYGETIRHLNDMFPHWFCGNYKKYNDRESELPFDQHELIALVAPRPLYVASAEGDQWSDPHGEFLGAKNADPVYRLLGTDGLGAENMPPLSQPIMTTLGYHIRPGKHNITPYDWEQYLAWADRHVR